MNPFSKKPKSLGKFSEIELEALVTYLEQPSIISRIALGSNFIGWGQIFEKYQITGTPPNWLVEWSDEMKIAPLFSIGEGDHIEGVAYIISDFRANEYWLGVAGGLLEVVESHNLIQIKCASGILTASDVFPVWTSLLSYDHPDLYNDLFSGDFKIYDKNLLPEKHLIKFKKSLKTD
jgi:hypothetical protein